MEDVKINTKREKGILEAIQKYPIFCFNDIFVYYEACSRALLQCGVDKDMVEIMLPREDFIYMKTVLSYETSAYHKFFHLTDNVNEFILCGMKIKSFGV